MVDGVGDVGAWVGGGGGCGGGEVPDIDLGENGLVDRRLEDRLAAANTRGDKLEPVFFNVCF